MVKYIVICGPVLRPHDSEILNVMDTYNVSGRFDEFVIPESYYGPSQVREFV